MAGKPKRYELLLLGLLRVGDAALGMALFLALSFYFGMYSEIYAVVAVLMVLITIACFHAIGLYRSWRVSSVIVEIHHILLGCFIVYVFLFLLGYVSKSSSLFSRSVVLTWIVLWPISLGLERLALRFVLRYLRSSGRNLCRVVIAGAGDLGVRLANWFDDNVWAGAELVGFFDDNVLGEVRGRPVLGNLESLPKYSNENKIDVIYLALPWSAEEKIQWLLNKLADSTVSIHIVPDIFLFNMILGNRTVRLGNLTAISLRDTPFRGVNSVLKRIEDIVMAAIVLVLTAPVMFLVGAAIKLTSRGPVLFAQWRYGLNGQPIKVYKFRTMTVCEDGYTFRQARKCDPRVTRLGAFLRKTSLDELPQFINVIQGRMSIVGPRPHPVAMNEEYRKLVPGYMLRHKVKPGITGLAQVNGCRGETDVLNKMEKRVEYDLEYLRRWSLSLDIKLIAQTIFGGVWKTDAQ